MRRTAAFMQWICFALVLGVIVLHIPLDGFRAKTADPCSVASCCPGVTWTAASGEPTVHDDASPPVPTDGCDSGCHCGCCGGLPLVADSGPAAGFELPGAPSSTTDRPGARRARPLEIFHPPRA